MALGISDALMDLLIIGLPIPVVSFINSRNNAVDSVSDLKSSSKDCQEVDGNRCILARRTVSYH